MSDKLDLSALRQAIESLEAGISVVSHKDWFDTQPQAVQDTLIAGAIRNFEFVYEIGVKMIRRQIEREAASPAEVDATDFRDLLRTAGVKGLVADVEAWFGYRKMRNITAHTYDHAKARSAYQGTLRFVRDARALLEALDVRNR